MNVKIQIKKNDSSSLEEIEILSFSFKKNLYTPYTMLTANFNIFLYSAASPGAIHTHRASPRE